MDLFEYQAKELFAEYGVPVPQRQARLNPRGGPRDRRRVSPPPARPGSWSRPRSRPAAGARRAGSRWPTARMRRRPGRREILGMDIKGHTVHTVLVEEASDIAQEYYLSFLLDRAARTFVSICSVQGGDGDRGGGAHQPGGGRPDPDRPAGRGGRGEGAPRSSRPAGCPSEARAGAAALAERLWAVFTDEDATLVEVNPLILTGDGRVRRAGRQGDPRRQRRLPAGPRPVRRPDGGGPAGGAGQGQAPELRQARGRGRHHRQRRGTGHVHAGRGGLRRARRSAASGPRTSSTSAAARRPR